MHPGPTREAEIDAALHSIQASLQGDPDYWDFVRHRNRYRADALRIAGQATAAPLLEIGAYPYHLSMLLKRLGIPGIGVDLAPERSANRVEREVLDIRPCDIEREHLPFADNTFDLVIFNEVFEHLRVDPLFVLSEINRVMRPGGSLHLTTPNLYAIQRIARFLLGRGFNDPLGEFSKLRRIGHMGHVREYSPAEVKRFLDYAGFETRSLAFEHYYYPPGKRGLATRLVFFLLPRRFRSFQIVVASKVRPGPGLVPLR